MKVLINKIKKFTWATKLYRKIKPYPKFSTSTEYWEQRYKSGGHSGAGSYNSLAQFKAEIINNFIQKNNIESVIEFGCGDGNQLKYFHFKSYLGFDISPSVIAKCRTLFKNDPSKAFELLKDTQEEKADLVLSLDVIYHLVEESVYINYMEKLFAASSKYVIIYSTNDNTYNHIAPHEKHRKFTTWVAQHASQFRLQKFIPNRYPYNGNNEESSYSDFYVYRKQ